MGAKPEAAGVLPVEARCAELRPMDTLPTLPPGGLVDISSSSSSSSPSGFLSDLALDDVLFADIDTSMYDFDPCTTAGAVGVTAGSGLTKLSPVVTADDLLKSLASPYSGPAPQVSANQPFKIDLTELDHIMEVLVGSWLEDTTTSKHTDSWIQRTDWNEHMGSIEGFPGCCFYVVGFFLFCFLKNSLQKSVIVNIDSDVN